MKKEKSNNILILLIIILLALVVLLATETISVKSIFKAELSSPVENDESTNSQKQKSSVETSKILEYYKERTGLYAADSSNAEHYYAIEDINNDGIPELFVYFGGFMENVVIGETSIYTYDENFGSASNHYIVSIGTIPGRLNINTLFYKMNDGNLLSVYAHSGHEETSTYKLKNNWLTRINHSTKETNDYTKGDKEIVFKQCYDTSLFDNYR